MGLGQGHLWPVVPQCPSGLGERGKCHAVNRWERAPLPSLPGALPAGWPGLGKGLPAR